MILSKCFFCGEKHVDYGSRTHYSMDKLAQKSSYELLIMILTDMKKFIRSEGDEPTLMNAITCFSKFSIFEAEECCTCGENHYSKLHHVIFGGILRKSDQIDLIILKPPCLRGGRLIPMGIFGNKGGV